MSYIVPKNKPNRCTNCPFMDRITYDCMLMYENYYPDFETQYNNCPLVEIPNPHGRLIDADELKTAFPRCDNSMDIKIASVRATINHVPTVIEAEE